MSYSCETKEKNRERKQWQRDWKELLAKISFQRTRKRNVKIKLCFFFTVYWGCKKKESCFVSELLFCFESFKLFLNKWTMVDFGMCFYCIVFLKRPTILYIIIKTKTNKEKCTQTKRLWYTRFDPYFWFRIKIKKRLFKKTKQIIRLIDDSKLIISVFFFSLKLSLQIKFAPWIRHTSNYQISWRRSVRQRGNILHRFRNSICRWPVVSIRLGRCCGPWLWLTGSPRSFHQHCARLNVKNVFAYVCVCVFCMCQNEFWFDTKNIQITNR